MNLEESRPPKSETNLEAYNCAICLNECNNVIAKLDGCSHIFCFDCIHDWSKVTNQCPLCKERFKRISKFSQDGIKLGDLRVKFKAQVADEEPQFEILENTDDFCYECRSASNMLLMLVCDECEFHCCHTYCCDPPLPRVPQDAWYCKYCRPPARPQIQYRRSNTSQSIPESAVTQSIRNSLGENSILRKLFEVADKETEKRFKSSLKRANTSLSADKNKAVRGRSRQKPTKTRNSKKSVKQRSRTKSLKRKAVKTTGSRKASRSVDKKKKSGRASRQRTNK